MEELIKSVEEAISDMDDIMDFIDEENANILNDIAYKLEAAISKARVETHKNNKER